MKQKVPTSAKDISSSSYLSGTLHPQAVWLLERMDETTWAKIRKNQSSLLRHQIITALTNDGGKNKNNALLSKYETAVSEEEWLGLARERILEELNTLYEEYTFATAKDASLTDELRDTTDMNDHQTEDSLVYGEVDLAGFCQLLTVLEELPQQQQPHSQGYFYDLGSGSGRAVFAARFHGDYQACIGVELLPNLHELASSVAGLYKFQHYQDKLHPDCRQVKFVCSDLLEYEPWWNHPAEDPVTIYIPNLLFDKALSDQIAQKAMHVQPGTLLMCLKQFIIPEWQDAFTLVQQKMVAMSWGESCVYIYQRRVKKVS